MTPFTTLAPYSPANPLLPVIGEHTLVRAVGPSHTLARTDALGRLTDTVWRLAHELEHTRSPVSVMELASRAGLSRGTVILAVTELLRRHRIKVGRPHTVPRDPLVDLRDGLSTTGHFAPDLRSAKILVLGNDLLAQQFVGACSHNRPLAVQETVLEEVHQKPAPEGDQGEQETSTLTARFDLRQMLISMGQVPVGDVRLSLVTLPTSQLWDAVWPSAARDACAIIVIAHPDHMAETAHALDLVRPLDLPVQVVLDHPDCIDPNPQAMAERLDVDAQALTLADVRSVSSTRAALRDLLHQPTQQPEPGALVLAAELTEVHDCPLTDQAPKGDH